MEVLLGTIRVARMRGSISDIELYSVLGLSTIDKFRKKMSNQDERLMNDINDTFSAHLWITTKNLRAYCGAGAVRVNLYTYRAALLAFNLNA